MDDDTGTAAKGGKQAGRKHIGPRWGLTFYR